MWGRCTQVGLKLKGNVVDNIVFGTPGYHSQVYEHCCLFCACIETASTRALVMQVPALMRGWKQVLSKGDQILKVDGKEVTVRDLAHFFSLKPAWPPRMSGLTVICQHAKLHFLKTC
jgi:hypothetical protein